MLKKLALEASIQWMHAFKKNFKLNAKAAASTQWTPWVIRTIQIHETMLNCALESTNSSANNTAYLHGHNKIYKCEYHRLPQYDKILYSKKTAVGFLQKRLTCILKTKMYYGCLWNFLFNAYVH